MEVAEAILNTISNNGSFNSVTFSELHSLDHSIVVSQLLSLSSSNIVKLSKNTSEVWDLTDEGIEISQNGSYEYRLYSSIPEEGIPITELKNNCKNYDIGLNKAMSYKWVKNVHGDPPLIVKNAEHVDDTTQKLLNELKTSYRRT